MTRIRIGIRFDPRLPSGDALDGSRSAVHAILECAARAEALGLDTVWVAERPARADAAVPAALPVCAAIAARTERLRIATGLLPLPLFHPLRLAEDVATLDGIARGRFELGVGLGSDPEGMERFGLPGADRVGRFEEALALIRGAWAPGSVAFQGRHFQIAPTLVVPKPGNAAGPPLWIGVRRPAAQRRAAVAGAGLVLRPDASPAPYLARCASRGGAPAGARVAWFLPPVGRADDALAAGRALLERAQGAEQVDLVFDVAAPLQAGRALAYLGECVAPSLRAFGSPGA